VKKKITLLGPSVPHKCEQEQFFLQIGNHFSVATYQLPALLLLFRSDCT